MFQILALFFSLILTESNSASWAVNVLVSSSDDGAVATMSLTARQYLRASNFYLVMQPDCNLVTYNGSTPFLTTQLKSAPVGAASTWNCYATLQADGDFVIHQRANATSAIAVWDTHTSAGPFFRNILHRFMVFESDGSLSMYSSDGRLLSDFRQFVPVNASRVKAPSSAPAALPGIATSNLTYPFPPQLEWKPTFPLDCYPYLPVDGYFLTQGSKLKTGPGTFILMLGHDCKLQSQELWQVNNTFKRVIWDPQVSMAGVVSRNCELRLQKNGRLELRDNKSAVVYWSSNISGDDSLNWMLNLDSGDGHLSVSDILDPSNILWTSVGVGVSPHREIAAWPIVVGVVCGFLIMGMAGFGFWYFYVRPRLLDPDERAFQRRLQSIGGNAQVLSEAKIKKATNNFGQRIGYGGFGDVFYGRLADGQEIAAKVSTAGSHQSKGEFYNEIELLSLVHHKYLVSLLGYSSTRKHQVLIYEYMGGGDLRQRLQGDGAAKNPLSWRQRTSIALQVAEGLEYLHDKCCPAIIHRDVKSNNILLTSNLLVAKVADFGLSKLRTNDQLDATHITTVVKGTPGYLDPEYHETGMLTEKSDVYAFGIVLMELLRGRQQMGIASSVSEARRLGDFDDLADPNLGGDFDRDEFMSVVNLSLWCVRKSSLERPCMREVVQELKEIGLTSLFSMQHESTTSGEHLKLVRFGIDYVHLGVESHSDVGVGGFAFSNAGR